MINELKASKNMEEFFSILGKYYDLQNCKPGDIVKMTMIAKLPSIITLVGAKPKK